MVHNGGETITTVNQTINGGRWMVLGDYDLTPASSHRVEIRDDGVDGASVADAVRFVRLAETRTVQADAVKFTRLVNKRERPPKPRSSAAPGFCRQQSWWWRRSAGSGCGPGRG